MAPDGQTVAWGGLREQKSWWSWFPELFGKEEYSLGLSVSLHRFPSGERFQLLENCASPVFSPDGETLAVISDDFRSFQLWDLPIHKPIGKILGLAALAAVATPLAFTAFGWLRRNRMRRKANVVPTATAEAG